MSSLKFSYWSSPHITTTIGLELVDRAARLGEMGAVDLAAARRGRRRPNRCRAPRAPAPASSPGSSSASGIVRVVERGPQHKGPVFVRAQHQRAMRAADSQNLGHRAPPLRRNFGIPLAPGDPAPPRGRGQSFPSGGEIPLDVFHLGRPALGVHLERLGSARCRDLVEARLDDGDQCATLPTLIDALAQSPPAQGSNLRERAILTAAAPRLDFAVTRHPDGRRNELPLRD